jgi:hypothetical protein
LKLYNSHVEVMLMSTAVSELDLLRQLYAAGLQDSFIDNTLRKLIESQVARSEADLQRINDALIGFEKQYGLTSSEFWQRYQAGQMADTADFMEWNVLCKMRQRVLSRLSILRGNGSHD